MRNFTFILLFFLTAFFSSCGPNVKEAIKYNDGIIAKNDTIQSKIGELIDTYDHYQAEEMDAAYSKALQSVNDGIDFVTKLKPFAEDASFKNGALELFNAYKSVLEVEHKRAIELMKLPEDKYGEDEVAEFDKLREAINKKGVAELENLRKIQEKFAKTHQFTIETEKQK